MPRANAGRRGSSRDNRNNSFRGRKSSGRPFRKEDKASDRKNFSRPGKSIGGNRTESDPGNKDKPRGNRKDFSNARPGSFRKKEEPRKNFSRDERSNKPPRPEGYSQRGKPFRSRKEDFGGKPQFGKSKSRSGRNPEQQSGKGFRNQSSSKPFRSESKFPGKRTSRPHGREEKRGFFKRDPENFLKKKSAEVPETQAPPAQSEKIRLNRYIANSGVCSRREADELISMGLISVNGKTISELGYKVNPGDEVRYENRILRAEKNVYILLNKPKGYLTTTDDPQERKTVMHLLGNAVKERIYPVGRLDRNTTGLLLLTNDGDLADKLMHPSYNIKKIYKVELDRPLSRADFQTIMDGVKLEEGRAMVDDLAIVSDDGKTVGIELHIGWNRIVRRIFESLNYEVLRLDRSVYAGLDKKDLGRGHWRYLTGEEIIRLKHFK